MPEPEEYTLPPGLRVASNTGNNPIKLQPILIDPSIVVVEGDIPTRQADGSWLPLAASGFRVAVEEVSRTELLELHLPGHEKVLVRAPAAGKRNVPFFVYCVYSGGTPYTHPSGTIMTFANGDLSFSYGQIAWDTLGLNQADPLEGTGYLAINNETPSVMVLEQPIVAALTDPTGLADGTGTLIFAVVYLVI